MPLVEKDGKEFDFGKYKTSNPSELFDKGVLPNIEGLYDSSKDLIDGIIISHPHQDHYRLANFINDSVQYNRLMYSFCSLVHKP
jgi:mRNA degradation ribonuclease J1/J2